MDIDTSMRLKMMLCAVLPILFLLQAMQVEAGEYCTYYSSIYSYRTRYCDYGCCGTKYSDYSDICCSYSYSSYSSDIPVGVIVGSVIGGLAGLCILIGLIVCCCAAINNSSRRTGTVIQPANTNMQAVVVTATASSQVQSTIPVQHGSVGHGYYSGGHPPPYGQHNNVSQ